MRSNLELITVGELRQSLLRGYARLRQAQAQGRELTNDAESVLELLGDPQVLTLEHPRYLCSLRIPLVYLASWKLNKDRRIKEEIHKARLDNILTLYKRRQEEDAGEIGNNTIHDNLVSVIQEYIGRCESNGGLLLDLIWAPRPDELDHDEITSENWAGFHGGSGGPHWLFGTMESSMPHQLRDVNSLIRLTFPLNPKSRDFPYTMITLILGLAIEPKGGAKHTPGPELRQKRVKWIRRLGVMIMSEVPLLFEKLNSRKVIKSDHLSLPDWLRENERDALSGAVDDLHRRIAEFAARVGADGWHGPDAAFNFLIAFKELDDKYQACLRYRLSSLNLRGLGSQANIRKASDWQACFEGRLKASEQELLDLFVRSSSGDDGRQDYEAYIKKCRRAIEVMFSGTEDLDEVRRRVKSVIENSPYPMRLTPGYSVMNLSHPEIIQSWLRDPRARRFFDYPEALLVWEGTALPKSIYYSHVSDGSLPVGVCGINAEILDRVRDYQELQEIVDETGSQFRYILCEEELGRLRSELKEALTMTKGAELWKRMLPRFRRLAYYYMPNPYDYWTKLVHDRDLGHFGNRWRRRHGSKPWWELPDLGKERDVDVLIDAEHIPRQAKWYQGSPKDDFIESYLTDRRKRGDRDQQILRDAGLHRVKLGADDDCSLLVLVPNSRNEKLAQSLLHRFVVQCEGVHEDHLRRVTAYGANGEAAAPGSYQVFLSYSRKDRDDIKAIVGALRRRGISPWLDKEEISPGEPWLEALQKNLRTIKVAVILIGKNGVGDWQEVEIESLLAEYEGRCIIPVLLAGATVPDIPFLKRYQWVDYNDPESDPTEKLIEGIKEGIARLAMSNGVNATVPP